TPSAQNESPPQEELPSPTISLPQAQTIPSQTLLDTPTPRRLTKETIRISQSKVSLPGADEIVPLTRGDRDGETFPTVSSLDAVQARETIAKTSVMPHEASP
ncbi:hypothetical protein Tco_0176322, partial [Tanacetum coccineum]